MAYLLDANVFIEAKNRYAHAHKHVVATLEVPSDGVRGVKIPNACIGMGVKFVTPFEMLRQERARFVLGGKS